MKTNSTLSNLINWSLSLSRPFMVLALAAIGLNIFSVIAQTVNENTILIEPLFPYPVPPEDLTNLSERSDYLMDHFWDQLKTNDKSAVDQNALNHAFEVYSTAMQWATPETVLGSSDNLLKKLEKNPTLLLQIARAAEDNLYGPRASMWIDDVYLKYAKAVIKNKKIDKTRKIRFERQVKSLESSAIGKKAPDFEFSRADGRPGRYFPMSTPTILYFGDPDCFECRMGKLKLETDLRFPDLVKEGRFNVVYIIPDAEAGWETEVKDFDPKWAIGTASDIDEIYDLRLTPSIFIIDNQGIIRYKNISASEAVIRACEIAEELRLNTSPE